MAVRLAIEPVGNNSSINLAGWEQAWEDMVVATAEKVEDYFKQSFQGFHAHSPSVSRRPAKRSQRDTTVIVGVLDATPDNAIYSFVNWGTAARIIRARNPQGGLVLRFRARYTPATHRGTLSGGQWVKSGPWRVEFFVHHPGIKARRFDEVIQLLAQLYMDQEARNMLRSQRGKTWKK